MELTIQKTDLARALARCASIADKRSAMPMLANVLLKTDDDGVHVIATDLYMSSLAHVPCKVKSKGSAAVSAKDLLERVKAMPDGDLKISLDGTSIVLSAAKSARRFKLNAAPGDDYPTVKAPDCDAVPLGGEMLTRLINRVRFAISTDETRPHLNSLLLKIDGKTLTAVATDGHRLSVADVECQCDPIAGDMLIPLRAVNEIVRTIDGCSAEEVEFRKADGMVSLSGDGVTFVCKLADGQFPPYQQVIPKHKLGCTIDVPAFSDATKAVQLAASERMGGVHLTFGKGKVSISAATPDGSAQDEVATEYDGAKVTLGVNARYVLDALDAMAASNTDCSFAGELDALVFKPSVLPEGSHHIIVIMPVRI